LASILGLTALAVCTFQRALKFYRQSQIIALENYFVSLGAPLAWSLEKVSLDAGHRSLPV
jgi:hypothetical protein